MITVVARWEHTQMPPELEWRMWRQLKGFGITKFIFTPIVPELSKIDIEQYSTMAEALANAGEGVRIFLEPTGSKRMTDLPSNDEDTILILGNSMKHNMKHTTIENAYQITGPAKVDMYPTTAAGIALAYRYGQ